MKNKGTFSELISGKNSERIPTPVFHVMTGIMKLMDVFGKFADNNFKTLGLKTGQTVIDYGCGPARYIKNASHSVGESGQVIAVDIHPLAIKKVKAKIAQYKLTNVKVVQGEAGYHTPIADETADVVYALDMFHMIEQPKEFLLELSRLLKQHGTLIIEDGHQARSETIQKIRKTAVLKIVQETKSHVKCKKTL